MKNSNLPDITKAEIDTFSKALVLYLIKGEADELVLTHKQFIDKKTGTNYGDFEITVKKI